MGEGTSTPTVGNTPLQPPRTQGVEILYEQSINGLYRLNAGVMAPDTHYQFIEREDHGNIPPGPPPNPGFGGMTGMMNLLHLRPKF